MLTIQMTKYGSFYFVFPNQIGLVNVWILNLNSKNQFGKYKCFSEVTKDRIFPLELNS